jgi:hypothetical protein
MFVREKPIGPYRYVYLVESVRENGRTKQRIIKNLGRKEQVEAASGAISSVVTLPRPRRTPPSATRSWRTCAGL